MLTIWKQVAAILCTLLLFVSVGQAANTGGTIDFASLTASEAVPGEMLVKFDTQQTSKQAMVNVHKAAGATVKQTFKSIPWQLVKVDASTTLQEAANVYQSDPRVLRVEPNYIVHADATTPNDPFYTFLWGMDRIGAPSAWDISTGNTNIVVAVIDTGIRATHEDLAANMWTNPGEIPGNGFDDDGNGYVDDVHGWDFVNNDNDPDDDADVGHGTHVAGTIGAIGNNGVGVVGVNWNVKLVGVKFLDVSGSGTTANAIKAIQYVTSLSSYIHISNNSWGGGGYSAAMRDAIAQSRSHNQLFIAAAGNDSLNNDVFPHYPSSYDLDNIIAVGSIDMGGGLSSFSCYGAESVDIAAPGGVIYSTYNTGDNGYAFLNGTSMATPHVAGAAALLWGLYGGVDYSLIRSAILNGAAPNPALIGKVATGGELNLSTILNAGASVTPSDSYVVSGMQGVGPYTPASRDYVIQSISTSAVNWQVDADVAWLSVAPGTLTLPPFGSATVTVSVVQGSAASLAEGSYGATLSFTNLTDGQGDTTRDVLLRVGGNYRVSPIDYAWIDPMMERHTKLAVGAGGAVAVAAPFKVTFYGEEYGPIYVSSRGFISFQSSSLNPSDNSVIASVSSPNALVAPLWDALTPEYDSGVFVGTEGYPPNRRYVISWLNMAHALDMDARFSFQLIIEESDGGLIPENDLICQFMNVSDANLDWGGGRSATIGLEDADGIISKLYSFNGSTLVQSGEAILFTMQPISEADLLSIHGLDITIPSLSFNGLSGGVYQVETRTNLLDGVWTNSGGAVTGSADGVMSVPLPALTDPVRFYRVKKTN